MTLYFIFLFKFLYYSILIRISMNYRDEEGRDWTIASIIDLYRSSTMLEGM